MWFFKHHPPHDMVVYCMQAKEAHEWIWYNIKDPNMFGLKPPRRWNHAGVQKPAPVPFYNRSDGHFLLNNSCTLVRLFLKPELRRLQCYFLPKLPKLIHPICYHPPIPHVHKPPPTFFMFSNGCILVVQEKGVKCGTLQSTWSKVWHQESSSDPAYVVNYKLCFESIN